MTNDHNPPASRAREEALARVKESLILSYIRGSALDERRERIATAAMQGLIVIRSGAAYLPAGEIVADALTVTDALIAELDRKGGEG